MPKATYKVYVQLAVVVDPFAKVGVQVVDSDDADDPDDDGVAVTVTVGSVAPEEVFRVTVPDTVPSAKVSFAGSGFVAPPGQTVKEAVAWGGKSVVPDGPAMLSVYWSGTTGESKAV